jgi:hypothetical protein
MLRLTAAENARSLGLKSADWEWVRFASARDHWFVKSIEPSSEILDALQIT